MSFLCYCDMSTSQSPHDTGIMTWQLYLQGLEWCCFMTRLILAACLLLPSFFYSVGRVRLQFCSSKENYISFIRIEKSPFSQWRRNSKVNSSSGATERTKLGDTEQTKTKNTHRYEQKCQSHTCSGTINSSMYDSDLTTTTSSKEYYRLILFLYMQRKMQSWV